MTGLHETRTQMAGIPLTTKGLPSRPGVVRAVGSRGFDDYDTPVRKETTTTYRYTIHIPCTSGAPWAVIDENLKLINIRAGIAQPHIVACSCSLDNLITATRDAVRAATWPKLLERNNIGYAIDAIKIRSSIISPITKSQMQ